MHQNGMAGIDTILLFAPLALDSKAGTWLAIPMNPNVEHTTINKHAGIALDPKSWDRVLFGVQLISQPLFHWIYANGGDLRIDGHIGIGQPREQQTQQATI